MKFYEIGISSCINNVLSSRSQICYCFVQKKQINPFNIYNSDF